MCSKCVKIKYNNKIYKLYGNDTQNNTDTTVNFYDATLFGHNSSSGSLAIYSYNQSYDAGSLTGTTEQFSGEDYRIQVNNNVVSFGGQAWTTTFNNYCNRGVIIYYGFC